MNDALFQRVDALYQKRDTLNLDAETLRVLENHWKGFVRAGAKLGAVENNASLRSIASWLGLAQILAKMFLRTRLNGYCFLTTRQNLKACRNFCAMR